jgi:putative mRNA 3-end processing factor
VLATRQTLGIMALRYGEGFAGATQAAGCDPVRIGDVTVRSTPPGMCLVRPRSRSGAAASASWLGRLQAPGPIPTCAPFEPVPCDVFITEATFGLPVFRHPPDEAEIARLMASLAAFPDRPHLVGVYALGKAQRVIALLRRPATTRPI